MFRIIANAVNILTVARLLPANRPLIVLVVFPQGFSKQTFANKSAMNLKFQWHEMNVTNFYRI